MIFTTARFSMMTARGVSANIAHTELSNLLSAINSHLIERNRYKDATLNRYSTHHFVDVDNMIRLQRAFCYYHVTFSPIFDIRKEPVLSTRYLTRNVKLRQIWLFWYSNYMLRTTATTMRATRLGRSFYAFLRKPGIRWISQNFARSAFSR